MSVNSNGGYPSAFKSLGFRFRWIGMILGGLAALLLTFIADPDTMVLFKIPVGASVVLLAKSLAYYALAVGVIHFGFKTMFDYIDRSELIRIAINQGNAGLVFIGFALFMIAFALVFVALIMI